MVKARRAALLVAAGMVAASIAGTALPAPARAAGSPHAPRTISALRIISALRTISASRTISAPRTISTSHTISTPRTISARRTTGATGSTFIKSYVDTEKVNPSAFGFSVAATRDGGYVVAGSAGFRQGWVAKLTAGGAISWQKQLGCGANGFASVQQTADGGYVLAGDSTGCDPRCAVSGVSNAGCVWVVKLTATGAVSWQRVFTGFKDANAWQIRQASDGGYVAAGVTQDLAGTQYAWAARLGAGGNLIWQRQIGASGSAAYTAALSVTPATGGGLVVAGATGAIGSSSVWVASLDSAGNVAWQRSYGTGYDDAGKSVLQTADGGYLVAGEISAQPVPVDALLLKLSATGQVQWQRRYEPSPAPPSSQPSAEFRAVVPVSGGYAAAGYIQFPVFPKQQNSPIETASWLARTDASGNIIWQKDYYPPSPATGFPLPSAFYGLAKTSDGGFAAVGYSDRFNTSDNGWLVRTDASGRVGTCTEVHPATLNTFDGGLTAAPTAFPVASPPVSGGSTRASTPGTPPLSAMRNC